MSSSPFRNSNKEYTGTNLSSSPVLANENESDSSSPKSQPVLNQNLVSQKTPPRSRLPSSNTSNILKANLSSQSIINSKTKTEDESSMSSSSPEELTLFVQNLLEQMQSKFNTMGDSIIGRIDEMGSRIDELEKSIGDLMDQAGVDHATHHGLIMTPSSSGSGGNTLTNSLADN